VAPCEPVGRAFRAKRRAKTTTSPLIIEVQQRHFSCKTVNTIPFATPSSCVLGHRASLLQPQVKAPVRLHHLPEVWLPRACADVDASVAADSTTPLPASSAATSPHQPAARSQMLGRQGRPETLSYRPAILLSYQPQHLLPELLAVRSVRPPPRTAVLQPRCPFLPVPLPQPLRLPVAQPHQRCRVYEP